MYRRTGETPPRNPTFRKITCRSAPRRVGRADAPTIEPGRAIANAVAIDWPVPTHSSAASTPIPSVISMTAWLASSPRSARMSVAPNSRASAWRAGFRLRAMIRLRAQPGGGKNSAESDRAVADHSDDIAGLDAGADCGVVAGAHDVGEASASERSVSSGMPRAGNRERACIREAGRAPPRPGRHRRRALPNEPPAAQFDGHPARQCGQVPSQNMNGAITRSP